MSAIDTSNLKSINDQLLEAKFHQEAIGIVPIKFDTLFRFEAKLIQRGRIINDDNVNPILLQVGSIQAPVQSIPPNSDETFDGWFSKIIITPHTVTGKGFLELDLVSSKDARKR